MTIRFLVQKDGYAAGYPVSTLAPSVEAAYVAGGYAEYVLQAQTTVTPRLPQWRKALANVRTGTARARIACVGDSTTMGRGGGTSTANTAGARTKSYPFYLGQILAGVGRPCNLQSIWGDGMQSINYGVYDPRVVIPSGWTSAGSNSTKTTGGQAFCSQAAVTTFSFTPTGNVDTFDVYTLRSATAGVLSLNLDGGAATVVTETGAPDAIVKTTLTGTLGAHTLNATRTSGGSCFILGINAYDSTTPAIDILNMGASGWTTTDWNTSGTAWNPLPMLTNLAPDLSIIMLGINDWATGVTVADFTTNLQAIITAAKAAGGDVILAMPVSTASTTVAAEVQATYITATQTLANSNSCPVINLPDRFVSYAAANALGFYFDDRHPSRLGYADIGQALISTLLP